MAADQWPDAGSGVKSSSVLANFTPQVFNGNSSRKGPQVGVRDPGELLLDGLQQVLSNVQALVRINALLSRKPAGPSQS